ncbi:N-acetylmuramoyl-L-alanine amidase [candidate division KSB1 bacterium]|nr:N-acetylmuramoyl-L-alanine amidase [candidate division KSB1 bacterium]
MNKKETNTERTGAPGWLELFDLSLHTDVEAVSPTGPYIRGTVDGDTSFTPSSDILGPAGERPPRQNLNPGWIELKTLLVHRDTESVSPATPYVHGYFDEAGHFFPDEPFNIIGLELDRPNKTESGQNFLWYPNAEIIEPEMRTRGRYPNGYPLGAIVHYTAGRSLSGDANARNTISWGRQEGYAYFCISNTGNVFQAHPLDRWGSHAGRSSWPGLGEWVSTKLVGIEVCCAGKLTKISNDAYKSWFNEIYQPHLVRHSRSKDNIKAGYYHKYTDEQEKALIDLILWLKRNNPDVFNFDYVLGHDEVAPDRKNDPGASLSMSMPNFRKLVKRLYEGM